MGTAELWFDLIRIVEIGKYEVSMQPLSELIDYQLHQITQIHLIRTSISFTLKRSTNVRLEVYDSVGKRVEQLVSGIMQQGIIH